MLLAVAGCMVAASLAACGAKQQAAEEIVEDFVREIGPGIIQITNDSDQLLTRLWLSPSSVEGLWPGASPEHFQPVKPGESFEHSIPAGWWDVWFEAEDGSDVLLYRTWFGDESPTVFLIEATWWHLGDWIEEAPAEHIDESGPDNGTDEN